MIKKKKKCSLSVSVRARSYENLSCDLLGARARSYEKISSLRDRKSIYQYYCASVFFYIAIRILNLYHSQFLNAEDVERDKRVKNFRLSRWDVQNIHRVSHFKLHPISFTLIKCVLETEERKTHLRHFLSDSKVVSKIIAFVD